METGTDINATRVSAVFAELLDMRNAGEALSAQAQLVYEVETLSQEVNSGASFEQYFRWVRVTDEARILHYLDELGLPEVGSIVRRAIAAAFPDGVPGDDDDYDNCTEWTQSQEEELAALFVEFEQYNGAITNRLGEFIGRHRPQDFAPRDRAARRPDEANRDTNPRAILAQLIQVSDPDELSAVRRIAWMVCRYEASISNGGHWRHFLDCGELDQSEMIAALGEIGAARQADLLARAVSRLPEGSSIDEVCARWLDEDEFSGMEDLDAAFFACETPLRDHLLRYLAEHAQEEPGN